MKKKFLTLAIMLQVMSIMTGCDFFRRLAGRPDSDQIEAMAEAMAEVVRLEEEAHQARLDSLERVKKYMADSLAALDSLKMEKVLSLSRLGGLRDTLSRHRYYIVLGSFSSKSNARKYADELGRKGYPGETIPFRNGLNAVGICGTDDPVQLRASLKEVRRQDFCPKEAWILELKQK